MSATMHAGGELDALVAEKVLGWRVYTSGRGSTIACEVLADGYEIDHIIATTHPWERASFSPSNDIADAWRVVEKMGGLDILKVDDGWMVGDLSRHGYTDAEGYVEGQLYDFAEAPTAPLAICLAALKSVEARDARP